MYVIATAGHVDHGKSTLVRALTGMNPDRLREEQEREMTIDLGFAWMTLPGDEAVGIVDVPGHIDFIENMLAGVGGIDAAILVIAADEGPMPQTREHLAILNLLKVPGAVVALTKADLAPDTEWLALVGADIRKLLAGTPLADSPIVPVSARSGEGLSELIQLLQAVLDQTRALRDTGLLGRRDLHRPRLPVDRSFSIAGFGTVVTGTLIDGSFAIGDEVEVQPAGLTARVRGLQTHRQTLDRAQPGSRTAINLSGISVDQAMRGSVIAHPGLLRPSTLLDVQLEVLAAPFLRIPLRHNTEVKLFCGTSEVVAHVRLLERTELAPGTTGWAQLELAAPVAVVNGDRFIVRLPSPSVTLGGGQVVDAHAALRYRRRGGTVAQPILERLTTLAQGSPSQRLEKALQRLGFTSRVEALKESGLDSDDFRGAYEELASSSTLASVDDVLALSVLWQDSLQQLEQLVAGFHNIQPLAAGMPRESLRNKLQLLPRASNALIHHATSKGILVDDGDTVRLQSHRVRFTVEQQRRVDASLAQCRAQPFNTPSVKDCRSALTDAVYEVLLRQGQLIQVNAEVVFLRETYVDAARRVRELIERDGQITAAQVRDAFGTTRKYALGLLEHLDTVGITKRVGDARVLK